MTITIAISLLDQKVQSKLTGALRRKVGGKLKLDHIRCDQFIFQHTTRYGNSGSGIYAPEI